MPKKELEKYYLASDLFVFPSHYGAWGLVINEAMAHGLPIIFSDGCVAASELICSNETGFLIDCGNVNQLREKIVFLLENPSVRHKMYRIDYALYL